MHVLVVLVEKGGLFAQHKVVYFVIGTRVRESCNIVEMEDPCIKLLVVLCGLFMQQHFVICPPLAKAVWHQGIS